MGRGLFLVFEGIDASGKSTHARRVAAERGALFAFEPGDTAMGAELRRWVLDAQTSMTPTTESLLMLTDRSHHAATVIEPALANGRDVVCDRYYASTLAYQGYGRGVDLSELRSATALAIGSCRPDVTILLDITLEVAEERRVRNHEDRFESADLAFHERVRAGYLDLAAQSEDRWVVVDGAASEEEVARRIDAVLASMSRPDA